MLRTPLVLTLLLAGAAAQDKLDTRRFMVHDYKNVVSADLSLLHKYEIWDDLEASALNIAFGMAEKELGFPLQKLDRFSMTMFFPDEEQREEGAHTQRMFVLEGREELALSGRMLESHEEVAHGDHTLYQREWSPDEAFVRPTPKVQVWGHADVIKGALDGTRRPGLPSADVMSLSVGRGKRLAYLVADLSERSARNTFLRDLFEGSEWPEDDMPTFFAARVLITGDDEDDLHLALEVVLRHAKVGDGVAASSAAVDAALKRGIEMPQLRLFRKILKGAEKKTSGSDVVVRVDLGRTRDAVGNLAMVIAPLFLMSAREVAAEPLEVVEVAEEVTEEVEEPPPPPPPEQPAGGGGGGR